MTAGFEGGGSALFGISGRSWEEAFWKPGERADPAKSIFIGPSSPNSGQGVYEKDMNNFGPAIGFAWQLPWFGKGKTTLRGGYQLTYTPSARVTNIADTLGAPPGTRGSFGRNRIDSPGEWTLDMAMSKGMRITKGMNFQIRLDANNILNHPVPSYGSFSSGISIIVAQPPVVNINSANPFGYLDNKVGTRTFRITGRLNF